MKAFSVLVNGQKIATLGIGDQGVLSAGVNWVVHRPVREADGLYMRLAGLDSTVGEHVSWPAPLLGVGDEVTIRCLDVEQVDAPTGRRPSSPLDPQTASRTRCPDIRDRVANVLGMWRQHRPEPWGQVLFGGAGVRFPRGANATVRVDVVYVPAGVTARQLDYAIFVDTAPVLAVEILAPQDTMGEVWEKVDACLAAGVSLMWVINPRRRTVTIYQPDAEPEQVNVRQELSGEPHLPGFRVPVAQLFA
jgi:Uma2 family endonuclease